VAYKSDESHPVSDANTDTPPAAAMLTMLSALAQLDRAFILARTKEGGERAKARAANLGVTEAW
jgi:DNA invertase Pin-like site-specific DNA recombinase